MRVVHDLILLLHFGRSSGGSSPRPSPRLLVFELSLLDIQEKPEIYARELEAIEGKLWYLGEPESMFYRTCLVYAGVLPKLVG